MVTITNLLDKHLTEALADCAKAIAPYCHRTEEQKKQAEQKDKYVSGGPAKLLAELNNIISRDELFDNIEYERLCGLKTMSVHFLKNTAQDDYRYPQLTVIREKFLRLSNLLQTALNMSEQESQPDYEIGINYFARYNVRLLSSINIITENIKTDKLISATEQQTLTGADSLFDSGMGETPYAKFKPRQLELGLNINSALNRS